MRPVLPSDSSAPLQRSVAACLAAILELGAAEVPVPEEEHPEPWAVWRNWLAQRGLGLVPIAEPAGFNWAGPWIAVLRSAEGHLGAVAFGSPPGIAWSPLGGRFEDVELGYVIAPADVALWTPGAVPVAAGSGSVEAVMVAAEAEGPMVRVERATARSGRGLEGDRYFDGRGTFSGTHDRGHDLTLVAVEALEELELSPVDTRRNVLTRGIDLDALIGERFRIGAVECFGQRRCEPCAHLERLNPGTLYPLIHKGGLRADVLGDGEIRVGDAVSPLPGGG